jgi:leucyl-tRNA synthetase
LVLMLSPFTPHMCEELWEHLGHADGVVAAGWPSWDEEAAREEQIEVPVQVSGKVRGRVTVPADADGDAVYALAAPIADKFLPGEKSWKAITRDGKVSLISFFPK